MKLSYIENFLYDLIIDSDAAEIIEYTGKIIKCNGNILENYTESLLNKTALTGNDAVVGRFYDVLLNIKYMKSQNFLDPFIIIHIEQYVFSVLFLISSIKYSWIFFSVNLTRLLSNLNYYYF